MPVARLGLVRSPDWPCSSGRGGESGGRCGKFDGRVEVPLPHQPRIRPLARSTDSDARGGDPPITGSLPPDRGAKSAPRVPGQRRIGPWMGQSAAGVGGRKLGAASI